MIACLRTEDLGKVVVSISGVYYDEVHGELLVYVSDDRIARIFHVVTEKKTMDDVAHQLLKNESVDLSEYLAYDG